MIAKIMSEIKRGTAEIIDYERIEKLIKDYEVIDKIFDKTIIYYVLVDEKFLNNLNIPYEIMSKEIIKTVFNKTND